MSRREFLAQGKPYVADKHDVGGYYMSEKLDGGRCWWDGGMTRGYSTSDIPWAGIINPKTGQLKAKIRPVSTGLWSRYGNPIIAPDWFLNQLPSTPLDGELHCGRGGFQQTMSAIRKDVPVDEEWAAVGYGVFSCPSLWDVMQDGEIKNSQMICDLTLDKVRRFLNRLEKNPDWTHLESETGVTFSDELAYLSDALDCSSETVYLIPQTKLPANHLRAKETALAKSMEIISEGGEGAVLRCPRSIWTPKRTDKILKVKQCLDDEGILVGYTSGRETSKGSRLRGKIGALILDYEGSRLELSGLTDAERGFDTDQMSDYAFDNPGQDMPKIFQGETLKIGDSISFLYRELSQDGIPKDARYYRKRS